MPENNEAKWYIIHTFGGYEKKVKMAIDNYAEAQGLRDVIQEVLLPTDLVVETKNGKRKEKEARKEAKRKEKEARKAQKEREREARRKAKEV